MKSILTWQTFLFVLASFFTNCTSETIKKERVEAEVKMRLNEIIAKKHLECLAIARDSADRIVDSLIFSQNLATDSSKMFIKPTKPVKPILKSKLDTAEVVPIFKK